MDDHANELIDAELLARLHHLIIHPRGSVDGNFSGHHRSPHRGSSIEFSQYRKYVPGDDIRFIDWRAYAKYDRFYVKEFEATTNMRSFLVLDSSASMAFTSTETSKLDICKRLAANLAYLLIQQGEVVGLQAVSDHAHIELPARGNPKHLRQILSTLASVRPEGQTGLVHALHDLAEKIPRRSLVIVCSDLFCDTSELVSALQHLRHRHHDVCVFHFLDQQEEDFKFDKPVRFLDMESSRKWMVETGLVREDYQGYYRDFLERVQRECEENHVEYQPLSTHLGFENELVAFIHRRMKHASA